MTPQSSSGVPDSASVQDHLAPPGHARPRRRRDGCRRGLGRSPHAHLRTMRAADLFVTGATGFGAGFFVTCFFVTAFVTTAAEPVVLPPPPPPSALPPPPLPKALNEPAPGTGMRRPLEKLKTFRKTPTRPGARPRKPALSPTPRIRIA